MGKALGYLFLTVGTFSPILYFPISLRFPFNRSIFPVFLIIMISCLAIGIVLLVANQDKFPEKRMEIIDRQFPCPVCKKDVFAWGKVPSARIRLRVGTGQLAWVRVCQNCGNVQQFTKTD